MESNTHSPRHNIIPDPIHLHEDEPLMPAQPADVVVDTSPHGMVDGYIDNLIPVVLDMNDNATMGAQAVSLAMHIVGRPSSNDKPLGMKFSHLRSCVAKVNWKK